MGQNVSLMRAIPAQAERDDDADTEAVIYVNVKGRRFAVMVASERRSPAELIAEFIQLFGDQMANLK